MIFPDCPRVLSGRLLGVAIQRGLTRLSRSEGGQTQNRLARQNFVDTVYPVMGWDRRGVQQCAATRTDEHHPTGRTMTKKKSGKGTAITRAYQVADSPAGIGLRAALAAIPFVGGSASIVVETHLSARQSQRVEELCARLAVLDEQLSILAQQGAQQPTYSEGLLEHAAAAAAATADPGRARVFADLLHCIDGTEDPTELIRRFLIDACATLSRYELALLLKLGEADTASTSDYGRKLLELHTKHPDLDEIRSFSLARLATFRLLTSDAPDGQLTHVGRLLISAV